MPSFDELQLAAIRDFAAALQCSLCRKSIADPHTTVCLHHFCRACIGSHVELHGSCPKCHNPLLVREIRPNHVLHNISVQFAQLQAVVNALQAEELGEVRAQAPAPASPAETIVPMAASTPSPPRPPAARSSPFRAQQPEPAPASTMDDVCLQSTPDMPPPVPLAATLIPATPTSNMIEQWRRAEEDRSRMDSENLRRMGRQRGAHDESPNRRRFCIVATQLETAEQNEQVQRVCRLLGAAFSTDVEHGVTTHIVTTGRAERGGAVVQCKPTYKYLWGLSVGCWIVSMEWIAACEAQQAWVTEDAFEIDCTGSACQGGNLSAKFRIDRARGAPPLFANLMCCVGQFFRGNSSRLSREQTLELLRLNGAQVMDYERHRPSPVAPSCVVVGHPPETPESDGREGECAFCSSLKQAFGRAPLVESGWVFMSLLSHRVEPMGEWLLHAQGGGAFE